MNDIRKSPEPSAACERVRGRLDELLDGSLPPLEAARDEGHLEVCAACAAEREAKARVVDELRALLGAPPSDAWRNEGLAARLAAAQAPTPAWHERVLGPVGDRAGGPVLAAAAAVLALVAIGASGAADELTAEVHQQLDVPADEDLRSIFERATDGEGWLHEWLGSDLEGGVR